MEERKLVEKLGKVWAGFRLQHFDLEKQLDAGLLLLLAGAIDPARPWQVKGSQVYTVSISGKPSRWQCNCPQGKEFGPIHASFANRAGRICKHIVSVVLSVESRCWPAPPQNLLNYLEYIAGIRQPEMVGEALSDWVKIPAGAGVRVIARESNLALKRGRIDSGPLVRLSDGQVIGDYPGWVERVKEKV